MSFRTPIKEAKGLGASGHGTGHWWLQRLTAIALVPLTIWFVLGIATFSGADYAAATGWLGAPINAVLMVLFVGTVFFHGTLGLQVVLEDYVASQALRMGLTIAVKFAAIALTALAVFAVFSIAFGGR